MGVLTLNEIQEAIEGRIQVESVVEPALGMRNNKGNNLYVAIY